ncbi:MAG: ankyrin repeat domain-containing protein [Terriglobia bacterium]
MHRVLVVCLFVPVLHAQTASLEQIRPAASHAVAIVQHGSTGFSKVMQCFSCHDHALPMLALSLARERGVAVDEAAASQVAAKSFLFTPNLSSIDHAVQDSMIIDPAPSDGWALLAAHAVGVRPNLVTAVYARRIANWQRPDGHWFTGDDRPPQSYSFFTATALALRTMRLYMPGQLGEEVQERSARARKWLLTTEPHSTEDFTFRLLGLHWARATPEECRRAAQDLSALQRPDGGWGELPHMPPDAYSTGEALVALHEAGRVEVTDPAWQKGLHYLLSTQQADGSWHVHTRMLSPAAVSPPYIESGFPYGHDQFLSTDATCLAAMALMLALPKTATHFNPDPPAVLSPAGLKPWMETALFGTAEELKAQLDAGLDPNSKTPEGTTLLMMAAPGAEKVKLLIDRGADVRAKAKSGFTALMVATTYFGTSASVKLLLEHGAEARPGTGVTFNASPLFLAALTGDRENIALLRAKGADPNRRMDLIGMFPSSPLFTAVAFGEPATVQALLQGGADIHERDNDGMTALDWAVVAHHPEVVKTLLAGGAEVNSVDHFGYTPLLYAATIDFGDSETVTMLLKAGADPNIKDKKGGTALAHARDYPYISAALEQAGAKQ